MTLAPHKEKTLIGLKKTQSLLAKIVRMVESNEYCIDVMQQNLAAIGLLKSVHQHLLEGHLSSCFRTGFEHASPAKKQQMIDEMLRVSKLANR